MSAHDTECLFCATCPPCWTNFVSLIPAYGLGHVYTAGGHTTCKTSVLSISLSPALTAEDSDQYHTIRLGWTGRRSHLFGVSTSLFLLLLIMSFACYVFILSFISNFGFTLKETSRTSLECLQRLKGALDGFQLEFLISLDFALLFTSSCFSCFHFLLRFAML